MRTLRSPLVAAMLGLTLLLGSVAIAGVVTRASDEHKGHRVTKPFKVRGSVNGLYPGVQKRLRIRISNPNGFALRLTELRAKAFSSVDGCPSRSVIVTPWEGSAKVPARSMKRLTLRIRMRPSAADACQGARYRIRYRGKAVVIP